MLELEVCNESNGDYATVSSELENGYIASKEEVMDIVKKAFGVVPFGKYSVNARGKSRIGCFTVYVS